MGNRIRNCSEKSMHNRLAMYMISIQKSILKNYLYYPKIVKTQMVRILIYVSLQEVDEFFFLKIIISIIEWGSYWNSVDALLFIWGICNHMSINHDSITLKIMMARYEIHQNYKLQSNVFMILNNYGSNNIIKLMPSKRQELN